MTVLHADRDELRRLDRLLAVLEGRCEQFDRELGRLRTAQSAGPAAAWNAEALPAAEEEDPGEPPAEGAFLAGEMRSRLEQLENGLPAAEMERLYEEWKNGA